MKISDRYEAMQTARKLIKDALKARGVKLQDVDASAITAAAKQLLKNREAAASIRRRRRK